MGNRVSLLMRLSRGFLAFLACGGLACGGLGCGGGGVASERIEPAPAVPPSARGPEAPSTVPAVTLVTLAGDQVEVARIAAGRVALVSLWATWCEACQHEMDALNRLDAKTGSGAVVIGIAVGEEPAKVADFARRRGLRYLQLVDPDFAFADAIGQRHIPATLVLDREGRIVYRGEALDATSLDALRRAIARVD
jgi:cytochrome c biogenesis protein CcmG/thiol:disulfide interchange protein DsbE